MELADLIGDWRRLSARMLVVRAAGEIHRLLFLLVGLVVFGAASTWYLVFSGVAGGLIMLVGLMTWCAANALLVDGRV